MIGMLALRVVLVGSLLLLTASLSASEQGRDRPSSLAVRVALHIDNLVSIDELRETWQVAGELVERWKVPQLAYPSRGPLTSSHRDLRPGQIWEPVLGFENEAAPATFTDTDFYVRPNGTVVSVKRFNVILSTQLDLRRFPFDKQDLPIVIALRGHDADRIRLSADMQHSSVTVARYVELSQWKNASLSAHAETREHDDYKSPTLLFTLRVFRGWNSYFWKILLPLFLIVLLSWVSFWLSRDEFKTKDQLATLVTTLLIIVAFNITATASLPRTNYVTYIDTFLLVCFFFVVFAIAAVVAIHLREMRGSEQAALHWRRMAGIVLPAAFVLTQAGLALWFFRF